MSDEKKPTAAEVVAGGQTEDVVKLQKKLAKIEDENGTLRARGEEHEELVKDLRKMPSARIEGKSVFDELNIFREGKAKPAAGLPGSPPKPKGFLDEVHDSIFGD